MRNLKLGVRWAELVAALALVIVLIPTVCLGEVRGEGVTSADILSRVQETYREVYDLTADFAQQSVIQGFEAKNFKGKLYLKKPGMARWDYTKPVRQNIVIKGDRIVLYFHDQKQAVIQKVSAHPDVEPAMGLLSNIDKWEESFSVKGEDTPGDFFRLKLIPRTLTRVKEVIVEIDKKTAYIEKLILFENSGNRISFTFSEIKFNSGIKGNLFDFKIPAGTEVLEY